MRRRLRIRVKRCIVISVSIGALVAAAAVPASAADATPGTTELLGPLVQALMKGVPEAPAFPDDPYGALADSVARFSEDLGVPLDPRPQVAASAIPADVAARLAILTETLHRCHHATQHLLGDRSADQLADAAQEDGGGAPLDPDAVRGVRKCAVELQSAAAEARRFLESAAPSGAMLDLWPVLRFDSRAEANFYAHDYALIIDAGGDDVYANNAGGNLLDVLRGPQGSAAVDNTDAVGCQKIGPDVVEGDCVISSSLLLDLQGHDTYGILQSPDPDTGLDAEGNIVARGDARCTRDPLIRRIVTQGAGLAGVGILIDSSGSDTYIAKTVSQGAGHLGGVGVLRDERSSDDSYLAVRNSQGFALVSGVGILEDEGGNDIFDYYMPSPLNPTAEFQEDGSGGVIDDTGACDNLPRQLQGTGFLAGIGVFVDRSGSDYFRGSAENIQEFQPNVFFGHGSQGFGNFAGLGFFFDLAGDDEYVQTTQEDKNRKTLQSDVVLERDDTHRLPSEKNTGEFMDVNSY